jgi:alpha-galactosidase
MVMDITLSSKRRLAQTPPMGWNSWDCFGTSVTEAEVRANAEFMAAHLLEYGWRYAVVDIQWYEPYAQAGGYRPFAPLMMDEYGRLMPATNRFPSATGGAGFKPLADAIHDLGLLFGVHVMRGIPRQAVERNLPVFNSAYRAADIADTNSTCPWNTDMFGLDMSKPGAQDYIDSIIQLYAGWGVDFIKADNMLDPYHAEEIEGYSRAIDRSGRNIVFSLSPGVDVDVANASHLKQHAEMWRISADFWDRWEDLKAQFDLCEKWASYSEAGHWPDADMLPLGHIGIRAERGADRESMLTSDEQITLMTLWSIFRSPLMFGGDLPTSNAETIALLTNPEVLEVNQSSRCNRQLSRDGNVILWTAQAAELDDHYIAAFNTGDVMSEVEIALAALNIELRCRVRDLWRREDLGIFDGSIKTSLPPHGAVLYRLTPC